MTTSPEVFARVAEELCGFIETGPAPSVTTYRALARMLAEISSLAFELADVEPSERNHARSTAKQQKLSFGADDRYREMFDPYTDTDSVIGSLSDDLNDIHADLARGLAIFRRGTPEDERDATWEWRFSFYSHWGEHATSAVRALYWLLRRIEE